ncbi:putative scaffolding protein for murein-synthesizing holoenzyme [Trichinella spiralis]|uniref:putative scaffolding protein for murein-synthesizing holoenzyme n=1 Tax=Trichinella spiralis TaxID=6334 RepID=UPI0001EFB247|nr:putative scaffolding protein for murein-synthesizing holoenzyme [Trichinella spiralis]
MTFPEAIPIHSYCIPHFEGQDTSFAMLDWVDGYRPVDVENVYLQMIFYIGNLNFLPTNRTTDMTHQNTDDNPLIGDTWLGDLGVDATVAPKRPGVKSP